MIPLARRLKHRVQLMHGVAGKDRYGGNQTTWEVFSDVRAEVGVFVGSRVKQTDKGGNEDIASVSIRIRYLAGVNPTMRLLYRDQLYRIDHAENERQVNRTWLLSCRELPTGAQA